SLFDRTGDGLVDRVPRPVGIAAHQGHGGHEPPVLAPVEVVERLHTTTTHTPSSPVDTVHCSAPLRRELHHAPSRSSVAPGLLRSPPSDGSIESRLSTFAARARDCSVPPAGT